MAIDSANLKYYLSGGSGNTNPNASLGGVRSTTAVSATSMNNLFDNVSSAESTAGDVEYRCVYFRNEDTNASGLISPVIWVAVDTPSPTTSIAFGVDPAGKNATATTIANESTPPVGVSFVAPTTKGTGISLPSAPYVQNDYVAIWIRRTIDAATASSTSDEATLRIEGDTI